MKASDIFIDVPRGRVFARRWSSGAVARAPIIPVLAIHGDLDEYGSVEFPRRITANVKGPSKLAIHGRCGHVPHRERSAEVLRRVIAFLEAHAQDPT